jgi:ABC-type molybdate transport system substrate-binding protein
MRGVLRLAGWLVLATIASWRPAAAQTVRVFAAGSLSSAFTEMIAAFTATDGTAVQPVFGPSGLLRARIETGEAADILASADMAQARALATPTHPVIVFTRNRMCAVGRESLGLTPQNVLDRMLDAKVRLATSTPGADPGGDYAWAIFARADAVHPGAKAILEAKALKLVGGPNTPPLVPGKAPVQGVFLADKADIMLGYCSGSASILKDVPGLVSVEMPPDLTVGPAYGMVVLSDSLPAAQFALFVMSEPGQAILGRFGFDPVGLTGR